MAITEAFKNDVASNNVKGIRIMMKNSMLVDPSFAEFNEMCEYAKNVSGLYDIHDGKVFIQDSDQWNDSYMNKTMVELIGNFSKERIAHLKKVVSFLRPVKQTARTSTISNNQSSSKGKSNYSYQEQKRIDQEKGIIIPRGAKIASGAVVGGAIGGTVAGVAGGSVLGGIATGAVVLGAIVAIATRGE